jgi:hypothetical protein
VLPRATTSRRERVQTRVIDKLGVTGSSPVPPILVPAKPDDPWPVLATDSVSQVLVKYGDSFLRPSELAHVAGKSRPRGSRETARVLDDI